MLVDNPDTVLMPVIVRNVQQLPSSPQANDLVYLTVQDGEFVPGLYLFSDSEWVFSMYVNALT